MSPSKRPGRDISRDDTQPAIPVDQHPGVIDCTDDKGGRKITAKSIPPGQEVVPETFLEAAKERALEHGLQMGKFARYMTKLSNGFPELHREVLSDPSLMDKLLKATMMLSDSQATIRSLQSSIQQAITDAEESQTHTREDLEVASQRTRSSIRALKAETEETAEKLGRYTQGSGEEGEHQDVVPDVHPGAASLGRRDVGYFNRIVEPNREAVAEGSRKLAEDSLNTIPVSMDRLMSHLIGELKAYRDELVEVEKLHAITVQKPHLLGALLDHFQSLLRKYDDCLAFTLSMIVRMPQGAYYQHLAQVHRTTLDALEVELKTRITELEAPNLGEEAAIELMDLEGKLSALETARAQKEEAEEAARKATRTGPWDTPGVPIFAEKHTPFLTMPAKEDE